MIPEAVLSHATQGRSRVKVPSKKGNMAYFSDLQNQFAGLEGVQVEVNALTGSALFKHSSDFKSLSAFAEERGIFSLKKTGRSSVSKNVAGAFRDFDNRVKRLTGNELDVPGIAFLSLLGFGIYEIGRGNFTAPAWYTAFWYSLNIFLKSLPDNSRKELL